MQYQFLQSCVGTPRREVPELSRMIETATDITRRTFMKHCNPSASEVFLDLGYAAHPRQGLTAAGDYHISYHRSTWKGKRCYFFRWSAIEHIFTA